MTKLEKTEFPNAVVRQRLNTTETMAVGSIAMMKDIAVYNASLDSVSNLTEQLKSGAMPVGSVEFVRLCMSIAGLKEPENISYPDCLKDYFYREISKTQKKAVKEKCFVKPIGTKAFTGFVFDPELDPSLMNQFDREDFEEYLAYPGDKEVFVSEIISMQAEWRYYVHEGVVIGVGRYDPYGVENVSLPKEEWVQELVNIYFAEEGVMAFSIDIFKMDDGRYGIVEVNDGWALGLYEKALSSTQYIKFLWSRWYQMHLSKS